MSYRRVIAYSFAVAFGFEVSFFLLAGLMALVRPNYAIAIFWITHSVPEVFLSTIIGTVFGVYEDSAVLLVLCFIIQILFLTFVSFIRLSMKYGPRVEEGVGETKQI